jgi:hypothetical protein
MMRELGYTAVLQDRSKSKFTICNVTFFQASKLCCTWTDSRSRALITGFKLISDMEFAAELASPAPAAASVAPAASSSNKGTGAAAPKSPRHVNGSSGKKGSNANRSDEGLAGAAEVFVANCHLEGHPWKAQERFNQIKGVLARMERRQYEAGAPMDDARILVVGVHCSSPPSN